MALSLATKEHLAKLHLPNDAAVRARLERWQAQTGWNDSDICEQITREDGNCYSRASVNLYRLGRYPGGENPANTLALRAELTRLMDAHPTVLERSLKGETYRTESYRKVRAAFYGALENAWGYCIFGAPGTQKTRLLLALAAELEAGEAGKNGRGRRVL